MKYSQIFGNPENQFSKIRRASVSQFNKITQSVQQDLSVSSAASVSSAESVSQVEIKTFSQL